MNILKSGLNAIFLLLLLLVIPANAEDVSITTNTYFPEPKITILIIQNATNFTSYNSTDTPANTLEFWINNSRIWLSATSNTTVSSIAYNNVTDVWTFYATGSGYLNITTLVSQANTAYDLQTENGITKQFQTSDAGKAVNFNYTGWTTHQFKILKSTFNPTTPSNLVATTFNFGVNYTWTPGTNTSTFNVSTNGTWTNGSTATFINKSTVPHGYINISVSAYNVSTGLLSSAVASNTTIPNNAITISGVSSSYALTEGDTLSIDAEYSDADGDIGTFGTNATRGSFNINTGILSWFTGLGDSGSYNWYINVSDGHGSTATQPFIVTVSVAPTPTPTPSPTPTPTPFPDTLIISIVNNTKTNNTATKGINLNNSQTITFYASANQNVTSWQWTKDNVLQVNNFDNYTTSFTTGTYHYIKANATNGSNTSNTIIWGLNVLPQMASSTIQALNETPANDMMDAITNADTVDFIVAAIAPEINLLGLFFYAIVWMIVFGMMWLKQGSLNIPMTIGVIFGGLLITFLPAQYQLVSQVLIVFGIFAVVYLFYKGRG